MSNNLIYDILVAFLIAIISRISKAVWKSFTENSFSVLERTTIVTNKKIVSIKKQFYISGFFIVVILVRMSLTLPNFMMAFCFVFLTFAVILVDGAFEAAIGYAAQNVDNETNHCTDKSDNPASFNSTNTANNK